VTVVPLLSMSTHRTPWCCCSNEFGGRNLAVEAGDERAVTHQAQGGHVQCAHANPARSKRPRSKASKRSCSSARKCAFQGSTQNGTTRVRTPDTNTSARPHSRTSSGAAVCASPDADSDVRPGVVVRHGAAGLRCGPPAVAAVLCCGCARDPPPRLSLARKVEPAVPDRLFCSFFFFCNLSRWRHKAGWTWPIADARRSDDQAERKMPWRRAGCRAIVLPFSDALSGRNVKTRPKSPFAGQIFRSRTLDVLHGYRSTA
jgi:hypothetical protein